MNHVHILFLEQLNLQQHISEHFFQQKLILLEVSTVGHNKVIPRLSCK